jgi:hypothetical protein
MQKRLRGSKRAIIKKVTAVNLFADQATQIQAIMEATGAQEVAPVVRLLLDEALRARRRKSVHSENDEPPPPTQDVPETLQTIQTLLLRLIQTNFRIGSLSLELLQETLVEARAGRMDLWESVAIPALRNQGKSAEDIANPFDAQTEEAKDFAYGLAEELKNQLDGPEADSEINSAIFTKDGISGVGTRLFSQAF